MNGRRFDRKRSGPPLSTYFKPGGTLMTGAEILTIGKALIWWGIPLAFAIWQLVSVRREIRRDRERSR